ncbi:MAG TPA: phosphotransferase family protein [Alphaproteobacteria bacterium]|nr:phosphotransferase family protein [Alphaproteobacteria bacterium]
MTDSFDDIRRAVRRRFGDGARIENIVVPTLGGVNRTVLFDLVQDGTSRRLVSRQETYTAEDSPFLATVDQFRAMKLAFDHGVPVPEPVFEYDAADGMGNGFVTAFVSGETMPQRILRRQDITEMRGKLTGQLAHILVQLHTIDVAKAGFLESAPDSGDIVGKFLERYDSYAEAHPAIELGFRWLARNKRPAGRRALVHGDFRTGNFMVGPEGVTAVLDWECAHLGRPIEDIGWLCTRSWRFGQVEFPVGGLGLREPFYAAYKAAGGERIDPEAVHFWEIFGFVRWAIYNIMQAHGHTHRGRRGVAFAAMGRNTCLVEYELLMTLAGRYC